MAKVWQIFHSSTTLKTKLKKNYFQEFCEINIFFWKFRFLGGEFHISPKTVKKITDPFNDNATY